MTVFLKNDPMNGIIKPILTFALISIGIHLFRRLIFSQFDLAKLFDWNFLIFEIAVEFALLCITALFASILSKKIAVHRLGYSLLKALIFSILYGIVSMMISRIVLLSIGAEIGFQFDIHQSFLKFIPNGFTQGILYVFVCTHLTPKNTYTNN
jgi:hypothetical protein